MAKNKVILIIIVSFIILILFLLIGLFIYLGGIRQSIIPGYGSEEELYYEDHQPGICIINVRNNLGVLENFEIDVTVGISGNEIIKTFDGTPGLPITYDSNFGENGCRGFGLTYTDYPHFWTLVRSGVIERTADYCPSGSIDPTPYDGIENYKCDALCVPDSSICQDTSTLKKCRSDGNSVETIQCSFECENGVCLGLDYNLFLDTDKESYELGEDILVNTKFSQPTTPETLIEGVLVTAQIIKNNGIIREESSYTDNLGESNFIFNEVDLVGEAEIKVSLTHLDNLYEKTKIINMVGELIYFEVTTYSYTQYETAPIKFTVEMKDSNGIYVYPEKVDNLKAITTLTNGQIINNTIEYKGNGKYEISSNVLGVGRYVGKLSFDYEGTPYSSTIIEIDVEKIRISIDTSEIIPVATLDETNEYTIKVYDSLGNKLNPDNLWIEIDFPDGITTDLISFDDFTKIEEGVYKFSYVFPQVEKFTFEILSDKEGYVRGSAKASVAVSGEKELVAGPKWFKYLIYIIPIGIIVFFIFAYIFYRMVRKR